LCIFFILSENNACICQTVTVSARLAAVSIIDIASLAEGIHPYTPSVPSLYGVGWGAWSPQLISIVFVLPMFGNTSCIIKSLFSSDFTFG